MSFNNTVFALAFDSSNTLHAGGQFTTANGVTVNRIAKWNTVSENWEGFGSGMNSIEVPGFPFPIGAAYALAFDSSGNLHAGGRFTTANGVTVNYIAKWNTVSENWEGFGTGMNNIVNSIAIDSSDTLHAGGLFTTANGVTVNYIAKWNTVSENWEGFGTGMNDYVFALAFDSSGNLHAGGNFTTAGGIDALRTAKWNGSSWEKFIDVDSTVRALLITEPT